MKHSAILHFHCVGVVQLQNLHVFVNHSVLFEGERKMELKKGTESDDKVAHTMDSHMAAFV